MNLSDVLKGFVWCLKRLSLRTITLTEKQCLESATNVLFLLETRNNCEILSLSPTNNCLSFISSLLQQHQLQNYHKVHNYHTSWQHRNTLKQRTGRPQLSFPATQLSRFQRSGSATLHPQRVSNITQKNSDGKAEQGFNSSGNCCISDICVPHFSQELDRHVCIANSASISKVGQRCCWNMFHFSLNPRAQLPWKVKRS